MLPRKRAWSDVSNFQNMIDAAFLTFYDQSVSEVCLILIFLGLGEGMHSDSDIKLSPNLIRSFLFVKFHGFSSTIFGLYSYL